MKYTIKNEEQRFHANKGNLHQPYCIREDPQNAWSNQRRSPYCIAGGKSHFAKSQGRQIHGHLLEVSVPYYYFPICTRNSERQHSVPFFRMAKTALQKEEMMEI
ncbi:hypothetical protein HYS48_01820 [Candidatus Woesearchaeota archaeon]|nr:hypothetical protein [Candidatus Woesearchaeota archaeon]